MHPGRTPGLPSIECLEEALRACRAALLLVNHDTRFLEALTRTRWRVEAGTEDGSRDSYLVIETGTATNNLPDDPR